MDKKELSDMRVFPVIKGLEELEKEEKWENVSWEDAQEFIRLLNTKEGHNRYRLSTEAEWKYAARAGTSTAYSFGDNQNELAEYGWFKGNAMSMTHPVGKKQPNP